MSVLTYNANLKHNARQLRMEAIYQAVKEGLWIKNPPNPPLKKGGDKAFSKNF